VDYGNGDRVDYSYNSFGNIGMVSHNGAVVAKYRANSRGDINHIEDIVNELHHRATYDTTGRLIYTDTHDDSNQWLRTTSYDYDLRNNLTKFSFIDANGTNNTVHYEYNRSNQPWYAVLESGLTHRYFYDSLERVSRVKLYTETPVETIYTYVPSAASLETLTTTLISTEVSNAFAYSYYYDANGNITAILNGTKQSNGSYTYSNSTGNTYTYDQYNQLITDLNKDNATSTHYQYDTNGNITKKIVNSWNVAGNFPMGNLTTDYYTYGDTLGWGDLLTQYNGQTITYDEIGNPINYRNGMTMSWQAGRQLESITQNGKTYNFTYAHDGLRTKKSITSGNTTVDVNYVYEGDKLLQMTYDNYVLTFSYDANGIPVSFHVKNATLDKDYYYGTNSRGDIEVIYNADGTLHARYDYDAYGKILGVTAPDGTNITAPYAIANLNPLRYRSYVYDNETGLYYLQSRYYDPVICRFINSDPSYVSTGQDFNGYNMFIYCSNNPIAFSDYSGTRYTASTSVATELPAHRSASCQYQALGYTKIVAYDVPLYNQGNTNICWAYCQVMVEDYKSGIIRTSTEADKRAYDIAVEVNGQDNWDSGNVPKTMGDLDIGLVENISKQMRKYGPLVAIYYGYNEYGEVNAGHMVVITGVDVYRKIVYTNNPWGIKGKQSYREFRSNFVGNTDLSFKLYGYAPLF